MDILKNSPNVSSNAKAVLTPYLIQGIREAEAARLSWIETCIIEGSTKGPGQMGEAAYKDITNKLGTELNDFITQMNAAGVTVARGKNWAADVTDPVLVDFLIAAKLALEIKDARQPQDALQYGIARYHGAFNTLQEIQEKLVAKGKYKDKAAVPYSAVETELRLGTKNQQDIARYVSEVVTFRSQYLENLRRRLGEMNPNLDKELAEGF